MPHPLDGARAKIRRARRHFNVLEEKLQPFNDKSGYRVTRKLDSKHRRYIWRAFHKKAFPREHAALLISEVLHNCRCALNYIAWELAERHGGGNSKTQFPIYHKRPKDKSGKYVWPFTDIVTIEARARTLMEKLQPYHRSNPTNDLLWLLHDLNNTDKHKLLIATSGMIGGSAFTYGPPGLQIRRKGTLYRGPFEDGAIIAEIQITRVIDISTGHPQPKVNVKADFTFRVTLSGPPISKDMWVLALPILERIINRVERITNLFDRHMQRLYALPPSRS